MQPSDILPNHEKLSNKTNISIFSLSFAFEWAYKNVPPFIAVQALFQLCKL